MCRSLTVTVHSDVDKCLALSECFKYILTMVPGIFIVTLTVFQCCVPRFKLCFVVKQFVVEYLIPYQYNYVLMNLLVDIILLYNVWVLIFPTDCLLLLLLYFLLDSFEYIKWMHIAEYIWVCKIKYYFILHVYMMDQKLFKYCVCC